MSKRTPRSRRKKDAGAGAARVPPLHPNPQVARTQWESLNGAWDFALDPAGELSDPARIRWDRQIVVPFAPETPASGLGITGFFKACWYRRRFTCDPGKGPRLILHFGAVDYEATVWVNGHLCARHEGGYTPFCCDVTDLLVDGEQILIVHAEDDPHDLTKPRGKQDWQEQPHSIWYPRTSGIWQSVWLEKVGSSWLEGIVWGSDTDRFEIGLEARVARFEPGLRLQVKLTVKEETIADDVYALTGAEIHRRIPLADPGIDDYRNELLWSPEQPTLIKAQLDLLDSRGQTLDTVHSYTALRWVEVLGDRFMLNGKPRFLRLVLDQGYWPASGLTPPDDEAARRDVEFVRAMGFNGVRAHQRIPDPMYLYWADVLGLMVWEEMPSAYRFSPVTVARLTRQWTEAIARDRGHPCVVAWVPMNESWGVPDLPTNRAHRATVRALYHLTRALDSTRPVIGNDGWEMDITDIISIHDYEASPEAIERRYQNRADPQSILTRERPGHRVLLLDEQAYHGQPIMLTEFGGIALREEGAWGYSQVRTSAELANRYEALLKTIHHLPVFSGFCYTQFADTYQEANGLLDGERNPKFPLQRISAATTGEIQK